MAEKRHSLSKSTFIRGVQCLKSLYLHKHRPFLRDRLSPEQLAKFRRGHEVGKLAWQLFPGGVNCAPGHPAQYKASLEKTRKLISEDAAVIYEAAFSHKGVLVMLDILIRSENGWHAYEVKSSRSVSETYLTDAALQYYVITGSGLPLQSFSIIHLNPDYVRRGELNITELFSSVDVTDHITGLQPFIRTQIEASEAVLALKHSPSINPGFQCYNPYPCDFIGHCWKNIREDSVFNLNGISLERRNQLATSGHLSVKDIPAGLLKDEEAEMLTSHLSGKDLMNTTEIRKLTEIAENPVFVSLLIARPAVPVFDGFKPFSPMITGIGWIDNQDNKNYFIVHPGSNPVGEIRQKLEQLFTGYSQVIFSDGTAAAESLNLHYEDVVSRSASADITGIFSKKHFYRAGLDPDAEITEIASFLNLPLLQQAKLSQVMAGVSYMEINEENKAQTLAGLEAALMHGAASCRAVFRFLKSTTGK